MFSYILHFYLLKERNFIFFLSFVVYHKCWSVCPAGGELTNHTGPLLASDLVNWEAAQLLSWITDLCTELPRLRSRNRGGEWRKVSMGLWQGPVRMPWKMPLLLNNLLCCSRLKPSSPAPCSSVEDAFHACWGECTTKMPHGWCQRGLTQPKLPCPVPLLWLHAGPQPDTGTWEMSPLFSVGSTDPCTDRVPASPGITTGCVFRWGQASPGAHAGRRVCARHEHDDMWCLGSLLPCTGDGAAAGQAKTWGFWRAQKQVICLGDRAIGLRWVPLLSSYFPWDVPLLCYPHPGTKHRGETCLHPPVSSTAHLCALTQQYHEKPLLTETNPKLQYENYPVWKLIKIPPVLHQTQSIVRLTTAALAGTTSELPVPNSSSARWHLCSWDPCV